MKKWLRLGMYCAGIFLFILSVKKLKSVVPPLQEISDEIEEQNLESDALFYSESPKAVEAAFRLQRQME